MYLSHVHSRTTQIKILGNFHAPSCTTHVKVHYGSFPVSSCATQLNHIEISMYVQMTQKVCMEISTQSYDNTAIQLFPTLPVI